MYEKSEEIARLRKELSTLKKPEDVIDHYILSVSKDMSIMSNYPTLSILLFDKNNSILNKDKFKDSFVIDYRVQWMNDSSIYFHNGGLDGEELHYLQLHLYLYFKSSMPHTPSTLMTFECKSVSDIENSLSKVREYTYELGNYIQKDSYLGHALVFTDAM